MINYLISNNYIEIIENPKQPMWTTLKITDIGESFISSGESIKYSFVEENIRQRIPPYDHELYNQLREMRKILAEERKIPDYRVCGNNILLKLARYKPSKPDSMLKINGIGEKFMENYSRYFLNQIIKYKSR